MKPTALLLAAALPVVLAACQQPKALTRLDCPQTVGRLARVSVAVDGKACAYRGEDDLAVDLRLARATTSPEAALLPFEQSLRAKVGVPTPPDQPLVAKTEVDLPGLHVRAGEGDDAEVKLGPMTIKADDDGAQVRVSRDVRLKGQSLSREKNGFRATFLLAGDRLQNGYKVVGYEAAGARTGAFAIATYASKGKRQNLHIKGDLKRLVRRNGGV